MVVEEDGKLKLVLTIWDPEQDAAEAAERAGISPQLLSASDRAAMADAAWGAGEAEWLEDEVWNEVSHQADLFLEARRAKRGKRLLRLVRHGECVYNPVTEELFESFANESEAGFRQGKVPLADVVSWVSSAGADSCFRDIAEAFAERLSYEDLPLPGDGADVRDGFSERKAAELMARPGEWVSPYLGHGSLPALCELSVALEDWGCRPEDVPGMPMEAMSTRALERLWVELGDIAVDDDGLLLDGWRWFEAGTDRTDIWHAFDGLHPEGAARLMGEAACGMQTGKTRIEEGVHHGAR